MLLEIKKNKKNIYTFESCLDALPYNNRQRKNNKNHKKKNCLDDIIMGFWDTMFGKNVHVKGAFVHNELL